MRGADSNPPTNADINADADAKGRFARELRARSNRKSWQVWLIIRRSGHFGFGDYRPHLRLYTANLGAWRRRWGWGLWVYSGPLLICLLAFAGLDRTDQRVWIGPFAVCAIGFASAFAVCFCGRGGRAHCFNAPARFGLFNLWVFGLDQPKFDEVLSRQQDLAVSYETDLRDRMRQDVALIAQSIRDLRLTTQTRNAEATTQAYLNQIAVNGGFWQLYLYDASGRPLSALGLGRILTRF